MKRLTKSLLLICLGIVGAPREVSCAELESPAMVRVVNFVGPEAKIVAVLQITDDTPIPLNPKTLKPLTHESDTSGPEIELKGAPYSSFGDYVSVEGGRAYMLDVEGTARGVGGFGSQQNLTPLSRHH